ncbi:MAG TPA: long-chain fatty acid--CoA ligase [Solirubrobacteraceae bacterium]|nr:long-chain fatty acid--CoA ligase [Solirubrobacteraceae bacterium]
MRLRDRHSAHHGANGAAAFVRQGQTPAAGDTPGRARPGDDAPGTLGSMLLRATATYTGIALRYRRAGRDVSISYPELGVASREIARGLIALGVEPGARVGILSTTRAEWTLADCGALCAGAVVVPVYHTNSPAECAYVLGHSETKLIFCEDSTQAQKIRQTREQLPQLERIVVLDGEAEGAITLAELRRLAADVPEQAVGERVGAVSPADLATLVYTSGTTGPPKGCLLTHANLLATTAAYQELLGLDSSHVLYQFLPLAHVLARVAQLVVLEVGAQSAFWSGDPAQIVPELAEVQPTHFPAVPRVYEKIHASILGAVEEGSALQRSLFARALAQADRVRRAERRGVRPSARARLRHALGDRLVLARVRGIFGPRLQAALVGAAPVAQELLEFFDACGVAVLEGYGLTETCAAATLNAPGAPLYGTVGRPLPGTQVEIAPDGEILIAGPQVFAGYYKNPDATREVLRDGRLQTGDLGAITDDGALIVTGRKKDLIITSSGKNVTPVNIESALRDTRWISEAVVYGDRRPYLVALLTLDRDELTRLADRLGIAADPVAMAGSESVRDAVQEAVDEVNGNLARIEQIKRFAILDHDLTQSAGELTPTLKVKRNIVYDRYADLFAGLYRTETPS